MRATRSPTDACLELIDALKRDHYRFTTVSPATHALVERRAGGVAATDLRGIFGWNRPFASAIAGAKIMALMQAAGIVARHGGLWRSAVRISTLGDQLFMHSAFPTTQGDAVFFGPDTYRFINALEHHLGTRSTMPRRAVDIGCGAGPGAIVMALAAPGAEVFALDINESALRMTAINAAAAQARNVHALHSDLLDGVDGQFDLIIANPPYLVDAAQRTYRHGGGGLGEGLSVDIVRAALPRLAPGGTLLLYTGIAIVDGHDGFLAAIGPLVDASDCSWSYREMDPDIFPEELLQPPYAHAERIAAVLLEVRRH
jgi:SAM-dependent methyltransferase